MKEKTADIDILEELVNAYKDCFVENYNEMIVDVGMRYKDIQAISNLIAENKELKEKNNELEVINKIQEYRISVIDERELISKSKVKEEIDGKFKEAKGLYERGVQPQAQYTMKLLRDLEQSLLGKE